MKLRLRLLVVAMLMIVLNTIGIQSASAVTNQMEWNYVQKALNYMQGDWYNDSGEKVITIHDKYINGCEVVSAFDFAGGSSFAVGVFRIQESTGVRELRIEWNISNTPTDYITINDEQTLHKTQNYYFESIGGFHLWMSSRAVEQKIGKPDRILTPDNPLWIGSDKYSNGWYYQNKGIIVGFNSKSIDSIVLLKQSKLTFDRSGLNCSNTPEAFARAYAMKRIPPWPNSDWNGAWGIGYGEYIFFGKNMANITLSVYNN